MPEIATFNENLLVERPDAPARLLIDESGMLGPGIHRLSVFAHAAIDNGFSGTIALQ